MIPIPTMPKAKAIALQHAIEQAADRSGYDEHAVFIIMSHFWEAIADQVTKGKVVSIPGFGMFAPALVQHRGGKGSPQGNDRTQRCKPAFSPTRSFRQQVAFGAPPTVDGRNALRKHGKNHCRSDDGTRVWATQQDIRQKVEAALGYARARI